MKKNILVSVIIFAIIGSVYSYRYVVPKYKSTSTIILREDKANVQTYNELVKSRTLVEEVKNSLKINEKTQNLMKNISLSRVNKSDLLKITVIDTNPKQSQQIAVEVVEKFSETVKEIYNIEEVYIIDVANIPETSYNINHLRDILVFIIIGVVLAIVYNVCISKFKEMQYIKKICELSTKMREKVKNIFNKIKTFNKRLSEKNNKTNEEIKAKRFKESEEKARNKAKLEEEKVRRKAENERKAKERAEKKEEKIKKIKIKFEEFKKNWVEKFIIKKEEIQKKYNDYKAKKQEEKAVKKSEKEKQAEERRKQKEEINAQKATDKAEREAEILRIKEEEKLKKETEKMKIAEEKARKESELAEERAKKEAENLRIKEEEKEKKAREKEDAKYTDEYLEENLYPKTKYNKF